MVDLLNIGSSDAEILDYIFGENPEYHSFWSSGWSAHLLSKEKNDGLLFHITNGFDRETIILLSFGFNDFNMDSRRLAKGDKFDAKSIRNSAVSGIKTAFAVLKEMGFRNVYALFHTLPTFTSEEYWKRWDLPDVDATECALHFYKASRDIAAAIPTISILDQIASNGNFPMLDSKFRKAVEDAQPDFIKTQKILWDELRRIPNMISKRKKFLTKEYPHVGRPYSKMKQILTSDQ